MLFFELVSFLHIPQGEDKEALQKQQRVEWKETDLQYTLHLV